MIEIVQAGQAGKTKLLFDMHRLRTRVFKEKMRWNVSVTADNLEVDQFDLPDTVYLLALNDDQRVIGNWRLLPTNGPTMIRDVWPEYLNTLPMPKTPTAWEVSRFAIDTGTTDPDEDQRQKNKALAEMFCGLTELCVTTGIEEIYTFYDENIAKVIKKINCTPYKTSDKIPIDGIPCQAGAFKTDTTMLNILRNTTGIQQSLINHLELPPALLNLRK